MPKVLLLGSTDLTVAVAAAIRELGIEIAAIVSVGEEFSISYSKERVKNYRAGRLHEWAEANGVRVLPFGGYREELATLGGATADICVVAGWYHMVPARFRSLFPRGCVGFHASLLPQLRGGAPLNWAILLGLTETGVSLFELGDGVDDGVVYAQEAFSIAPDAVIGDLVDASRLATERLVRGALPGILGGSLQGYPQQGDVTYALQRSPSDGWIDWRASADDIHRLVRAVGRPYPGAICRLDDVEARIWRAALRPGAPMVYGAPGQIVTLPQIGAPSVVTGDGLLVVEEATDASGADFIPVLLKSSQKRFQLALGA